MNNLVIDNFTYYRIYIDSPEKLIKYSSVEVNAWKILQSKSIDFVNKPTSVFKLDS